MAAPYWTQAGDHTWGLVVDGRIVGLVYWTGPGLGEEGDAGGDPLFMEAEWFCLRVDDPDNHHALDAPSLDEDMSHDELVAAMDAAREAASREILGERRGN
jgi:hypothetical protein